MALRELLQTWPVYRQFTSDDRLGLGSAAASAQSELLRPRTEDVDGVVPSVCPFCAVGCAQRILVKDDEVVHVEGAAKGLTAAGAGLAGGARRGARRWAGPAGAGLLLAGSMCQRWAVYKAGFQSAADPRYVVKPQREQLREAGGVPLVKKPPEDRRVE